MLKLNKVIFSYKVNGKIYTVSTVDSVENRRTALILDKDGDIFTARIRSNTPIEIIRLSAEFRYDFPADAKIFLNGYQSWTDSREYDINGRMRGTDQIPAAVLEKYALAAYGDYTFVKYSRRNGCLHGFSYGYIRHDIGSFDFIGSLNESDGFTIIRTDTANSTVTAAKDCKNLHITNEYKGISLYLGSGSENEVFDRYFELMGISPCREKPIFGYTSWYRHYQNISEDIIMKDLDGLENSGMKADVFQIDDGYQLAVGDWLCIDKSKFPGSMKSIADRIKYMGMTPGIWLAPFVCEEKSAVCAEHPERLLKDKRGLPVKCGNNWSGFYALDIYNDDVRDYLRNVFDIIVNDWGFGLLKLDFLYAACILPRRDKTRGEVMSDAMDLLRECAGSAKILACGVPLASAFGKAEYCRIGPDVSLDWNDKSYMQLLHRERPSTRNTILNSVFRRHLNGRAFINDPDVFLLRYHNIAMTDAQKKCLAEINALTGGVLFTSDNLGEYGDTQKKIIEEMNGLREAKVLSAELRGNLLALSVEKDGRNDLKLYSAGF